jgi:hypothetical protein
MQPTSVTTTSEREDESFSFRTLVVDWVQSIIYAFSYWKIIMAAAIIGALLGLAYAFIKPVTYTARLSFVVEESKAAGGGSIASALAGQFGFDIGGLSGTSGVLAGDNVLELLKSYSLIKKTLLTPLTEGAAISLADYYAEAYHLKEKWRKSEKVNKEINFTPGKQQFTRLEDSLLQSMIKRISEKELGISKPDKKLGFFEIRTTTKDEKFSQIFCERLLKVTSEFYVDTKTKRLSTNVYRLQRRADSLGNLLDRKTYSSAEAERLLLDANPAYSSPAVNAEISSRNKFIQGTIYGEIIKNLEVSKTSLIQETPTVQVVDYPELPLKKNETWWVMSMLAGIFAGIGISVLFLAALKPRF